MKMTKKTTHQSVCLSWSAAQIVRVRASELIMERTTSMIQDSMLEAMVWCGCTDVVVGSTRCLMGYVVDVRDSRHVESIVGLVCLEGLGNTAQALRCRTNGIFKIPVPYTRASFISAHCPCHIETRLFDHTHDYVQGKHERI